MSNGKRKYSAVEEVDEAIKLHNATVQISFSPRAKKRKMGKSRKRDSQEEVTSVSPHETVHDWLSNHDNKWLFVVQVSYLCFGHLTGNQTFILNKKNLDWFKHDYFARDNFLYCDIGKNDTFSYLNNHIAPKIIERLLSFVHRLKKWSLARNKTQELFEKYYQRYITNHEYEMVLKVDGFKHQHSKNDRGWCVDLSKIIGRYLDEPPLFIRDNIHGWEYDDLYQFFLLCGVHRGLVDNLYEDFMAADDTAQELEFDINAIVNKHSLEFDSEMRDQQSEHNQAVQTLHQVLDPIVARYDELAKMDDMQLTNQLKQEKKELGSRIYYVKTMLDNPLNSEIEDQDREHFHNVLAFARNLLSRTKSEF